MVQPERSGQPSRHHLEEEQEPRQTQAEREAQTNLILRWVATRLLKGEYIALIGEAALQPPVGGTRVMAKQLRHLLTMAEAPNIDIRVVPSSAVHSGMLGPFLLLEFPVATPVVHIELTRSALFLEREDAKPYLVIAARVESVAFSATESQRLIAKHADELEGMAR